MPAPTLRVFTLWLGSLLCWLGLPAQCPQPEPVALLDESFEQGLPPGWEAPLTSDGGQWRVDQDRIGAFPNPGKGNWLYLSDEPDDKAGQAELTLPALDVSAYSQQLQLSFLLSFQAFTDYGWVALEVWDGEAWVAVFVQKNDFAGRVEIDLTEFAGPDFQLRFSYDDEGEWTWGMGIDELSLTGQPPTCGNGICDNGERPGTCADCETLTDPAPYWVAPGQNVEGKAVSYTRFKRHTPCDDCSEEVALGFGFTLYGQTYSHAWLNANGNLTFGEKYLEYSPEAFCLVGPRMIAPFFADVDLTQGGEIQYYADPAGHYFIVTWQEVGYYDCASGDCPQRNTFQLILTDGSLREIAGQPLPFDANVVFSYGDLQWTTGGSSGGQYGFGGSAATTGINQGDGHLCQDYGRFDREGYAYYGNSQEDSCPPNAVSHLDYRSLFLDARTGQLTQATGEVYLEGFAADTGNVLHWYTDRSDVYAYFVVQRGEDSLGFEDLEMIWAENALSQFSFVDPQPYQPASYYRLAKIGVDNELTYSPTIAVAQAASQEPAFSLLSAGPNPLQDQLHLWVELPAGGELRYLLTDMSGRRLLQGVWQGQVGANQFTLNLPDLPAAQYVITLDQGRTRHFRHLIKQ